MNATQQALLIALTITAPALGEKRFLIDVARAAGYETVDGEFAAILESCWEDGLVNLSRADMVYDRARVDASSLRILTEEFHYAELAE
jgi:hypothetical protein